MNYWIIHFHGKHSGITNSIEEYSPINVYGSINRIGILEHLVFDYVELRDEEE